MSTFDSFVMVDWSGGNDTGPTPRADAIWVAHARAGAAPEPPVYLRNRAEAEDWLAGLIDAELGAGRRLCLGFDFPFAYPAGFAAALTGSADPVGLWSWLDERIEDTPRENNRFDIAASINRALGQGRGPFWGNALKRDIDGLPRRKSGYVNPFPDRRAVERRASGSFTCWQLAGAGAVGSQVLMGLPVLQRLRQRFAERVAVWPFEPLDRPVAFVEIWPSLNVGPAPQDWIKDAWQVHEVARDLAALPRDALSERLQVDAPEEGWILGVPGPLQPPPLRNDCFALPAGVDWTPVDQALDLLATRLRPVTAVEQAPVSSALGRVLARDVAALRANPPTANTAVDGYGFAGGRGEGVHEVPLVAGRAAAGRAFGGSVPPGHAIRVLTGAALPEGVDTVILEEDVTLGADAIAFRGPLKPGANTRKAGEDVKSGDTILSAGRRLTPADLALLSATGIGEVSLRKPLRVAVVSTGDELVEAGQPARPDQTYDANRPLLLSMIARFGHDPRDMGRIPDDRMALADALDRAARDSDAILTSGGASAGDEDHVSALLRQRGAMQEWRIALKPGRPLALGLWRGKPVFGLPGNPVAAMVCTLIFARPALALLSGAGWEQPQGFDVPAGFEKRKKPGRREYLRARLRDGRAEVFASEGSGRISGLSWAEGLVELGDAARHVQPGDPVRYLPFTGFGL